MKKLRAFTLMELLIGMIVSSIVIGFGYGTFFLIYKQYSSFKTVKIELVDVAQLNSILNHDFAIAEMIAFNENKLIIDRKNNLPLVYNFNDSIILRTDNELVDTFKIVSENIVTNFVFKEQNAVVTGFAFEAKVLNETEQLTFEKHYSSETLMNYEVRYKNQNY
ncbi:MAG: PilW family protein [Bacteroidota bacterium]